MKSDRLRIEGHVVTREGRRPVAGLRVEAWDDDLLVDDVIARAARTGADGGFRMSFVRADFAGLFGERRPDLFFRVYRGKALLAQTAPLARRVDPATPVSVTILLDEVADGALSPATSFELTGVLRRSDGSPAPMALVRAQACRAEQRVPLGEGFTDAYGRYALTCRVPAGGAGSPLRLTLEALGPDGARVGEAAATLLPAAVETLDIVLAGTGPLPQEGPGRVINNCHLDLPRDDVVEQIEFERFFRLGHRVGEFLPQPPVVVDELAQASEPTEPDPTDVSRHELALYLPYAQTWRLQGYTRGRLVNSFALGPGEEQTVEVSTWDRRRSSVDSTWSTEQEATTEASGSRRDTQDVARDVTQQTGFELGVDGKVGFQVGVVNVDLKSTQSAKHQVNAAEKGTRASIVEATTRATQRVRASRTLHVTESREAGREERVTRKLRNPNGVRTLTVAFFEILANYRVTTALRREQARLVVLVPSAELVPFVQFNLDTVRQHETALRMALLDRALAPGFEAARLVDARDRACEALCQTCRCQGAGASSAGSPHWDQAVASAGDAARAARAVLGAQVRFPLSVMSAELNEAKGIEDIQRHLMRRALARHAPWLVPAVVGLAIDAGLGASADKVQALRNLLNALPAGTLGKLAYDPEVSGGVWNEIRDAIFLTLPKGDPISAAVSYGIACARADKVKANCGQLAAYQDEGLVRALSGFVAHHDNWLQEQQAARDKDEKLAELDRIAREERQARILEAFGLRETVEAQERVAALLGHLNNPRNIDHYKFAVWNERAGSMDHRLIGLASSGLVEPTPLGIVGGHLALPVRMDADSPLHAVALASLAGIADEIRSDDRSHVLPTASMHCEAVVGQCGATEPEAKAHERLALWRAALDAEGAALENQRQRARLAAQPPLLDRDGPRADKLELNVDATRGG